MRASIKTLPDGSVALAYDYVSWQESGRVERIFMCPVNGGYIREYINRDWRQVCRRLSDMGSTLSCKDRADLAEVIRREYRAMRYADKKAAKNDRY